MALRGMIVTAPRSGGGKTVTTLILALALRRCGYCVRLAKIGPDFIDPTLHDRLQLGSSFNLDAWAMRSATLRHIISEIELTCAADNQANTILLIEGVCGLFDGGLYAGETGYGSTADLARELSLPLVLVLDSSGVGSTIGAVASGLARFDPGLTVAGAIPTMVGSEKHSQLVRRGIEMSGVRWLGEINRSSTLTLPRRNLGLLMGSEHTELNQRIEAAAVRFMDTINIHSIAALARPIATHPPSSDSINLNNATVPQHAAGLSVPGKHIAIAYDQAFCFIYRGQIELWRKAGMCIEYFSPLADEGPSNAADFIFLPGGYPELHVDALSRANNFKDTMRRVASRGVSIYGECGGYIVLGKTLTTAKGVSVDMLGLLEHESTMTDRFAALGYRVVRAVSDETAHFGASVSAHEFHYATATNEPTATPAFTDLRTGAGYGSVRANVSGSFLHLIDRVSNLEQRCAN